MLSVASEMLALGFRTKKGCKERESEEINWDHW